MCLQSGWLREIDAARVWPNSVVCEQIVKNPHGGHGVTDCCWQSVLIVGVIDENRFLRVKATQHAAESQSAQVPVAAPVKSAPRFYGGGQAFALGEQEEHTLFLSSDKKRMVTLAAPLTISNAEYLRICNWIKVALIVDEEKTN
jgi:hypothetical protein